MSPSRRSLEDNFRKATTASARTVVHSDRVDTDGGDVQEAAEADRDDETDCTDAEDDVYDVDDAVDLDLDTDESSSGGEIPEPKEKRKKMAKTDMKRRRAEQAKVTRALKKQKTEQNNRTVGPAVPRKYSVLENAYSRNGVSVFLKKGDQFKSRDHARIRILEYAEVSGAVVFKLQVSRDSIRVYASAGDVPKQGRLGTPAIYMVPRDSVWEVKDVNVAKFKRSRDGHTSYSPGDLYMLLVNDTKRSNKAMTALEVRAELEQFVSSSGRLSEHIVTSTRQKACVAAFLLFENPLD